MAMAAVAGTAAVVGTLGHAPWQSAVALRLSSSRAFVPAQFGAQRFRFRGRLHLQSCHYRRSGRSVFVAQNSAQTEAKVRSISVFLRSGMLQGIFACVRIRKFCGVEFGCRVGQ